MALDDILERIREDARAEAERIRTDGESRAAAIVEGALREADHRRGQLLSREREHLAEQARRRLAGERLAARSRELAVRRELLDEVFAAGVAAVRAAGTAEYAAWLAGLVAGVAPHDGGELELGREDLDSHGPALAEALERELAGRPPGPGPAVRTAPGEFEAGVRVLGTGSVHDFSLASLVAERRERWEAGVAAVLFGE